MPDSRQAAADLGFRLGVCGRVGNQCLATGQHRAVRCQSVFPATDLFDQVGQIEIRLGQRPTRCEVSLAVKQRPELSVVVDGRVQQPVAKLPELGLLQQEISTHASVECFDRVDGKVVPRLHRGPRAGQLGVGPGLHDEHGRQTDHAGHQCHRHPGDGRAVPLRPPPGAAGERLTVSGHRLVGRPPLDVLGQRPARMVAVLGLRRHRLQADRLQRRVDRGVDLPGRSELAALDLPENLADVALERGPCRSAGSKAWHQGCKRRTAVQARSRSPTACSGLM